MLSLTITDQGDKLGVPATYRELTEEIINRIAYYAKALGSINYLAQLATGRLSVELNAQRTPYIYTPDGRT